MEWVVLTIWNTLGTPKLRNPPTPKQKQSGPVGCMVTGFIDSQGFLFHGMNINPG